MLSLLQLEVCKEQVEWATAEKRTFLRQRIEIRLAMLHMDARDYTAALQLIGALRTRLIDAETCLARRAWLRSGHAGKQARMECGARLMARPTLAPFHAGKLLTEVKRLDDKLLLVDIHLLESKVCNLECMDAAWS